MNASKTSCRACSANTLEWSCQFECMPAPTVELGACLAVDLPHVPRGRALLQRSHLRLHSCLHLNPLSCRAWKREHRPDKVRFDRPYLHPMRLPGGEEIKLTVHQARFKEQGFASTGGCWVTACLKAGG